MSYILGLDIGASKIAAGLIHHWHVSHIIKIPTQADLGTKRIIQNILKTIRVFEHDRLSAIGIGMAGNIDQKKGVVVSSPNLPKSFKNIPLARIISRQYKKKVFLENDANCFTLAESMFGAGKNYRNVLGLTLGTGIGGGIVLNKKLYRGKNGLAGELGHITVVENGLRCSCGGFGHLEVYASGSAMASLYTSFTGKSVDAPEVQHLAKQGDKNALRVVKIMNETLGTGFATFINIFNPDIIVLGGGLAHVKMVWKGALPVVKKNVVYPILSKTKIVKGKLGEKGPILGAALIAKGN